jgi:SAM-dependent methyltransferase
MELRNRTNMAHTVVESWRPPLLSAPGGKSAALSDRVRRYFDLQAGSIWNDVRQVLPYARGVVLDVGCGSQPLRPLVGVQADYRGIDTVHARAHFGYEVPDTEYFDGNVWPVATDSVDFVLCTETLEHVFDTREFLSEAARCLRAGGTILMTVPFAARWHFIPYDYWRFTPSSLHELLREKGFDDVRVYARGNAVTVALYKMMALVLKCFAPSQRGLLARLLFGMLGLILTPGFLIMAMVANLSLRGAGGDDCLGYTLLATKPSPSGNS